jgi:hypothetical protein
MARGSAVARLSISPAQNPARGRVEIKRTHLEELYGFIPFSWKRNAEFLASHAVPYQPRDYQRPQRPGATYPALQGFTVNAPIPSKSFVFRVTIVSSYASAVAAINESTAGKGLPVRDVCDRSEAQRAATRRSTGSTRPENHASRSRVSHSWSCARRLPGARSSIPF